MILTYIGGDFFSGISSFFRLKFDFSRVDLLFLFKFSSFSLLKDRKNPLSNSKNLKDVNFLEV